MADAPKRIVITGGQLPAPKQPAFQGKSSFVQRIIEITIKLAPNQQNNQPIKFAGTDSDTVTLSGFRTSVRIENSGAPARSTAEIRIYGMSESLMNELSALGMIFNSIQKNTITVSAGDARDGLTPVFGGTIWAAMPDYNQAPNVPFIFTCQTGYIDNVLPVPASSFPQSTDVATIMSGFARQMNIGFENNGVTTQIPPSYFPGTVMQQVKKCAQAAHIMAERVDGDTKLAIWPIGGSRTSAGGAGQLPLISKDTGMIGYPSPSPNGYLIVKTLFNPQIAFGGTVKVQSEKVPLANRTWVVQKMDLALDAYVPKGQWMAVCYCYPVGFAAPPPPSNSGG